MSVNKSGSGQGSIKESTQVFNPATGHYIKRDSSTGQLEVKSDGKKFKGVKVVKTIIKANPSVKKSTAKKAEDAIIKEMNKKKSKK